VSAVTALSQRGGRRTWRLRVTNVEISLTRRDCRSNLGYTCRMDRRSHTSASLCARRYKAFVLLLVLTTIALGVHIELARCEAPLRLPGKHILHGDLRPDAERAGKRLAELPAATPSRLLVIITRQLLEPPNRRPLYVVSFSEPSVRELLNFLVLFVRPPPALHRSN
jgi:hypothetical protein